MAASRAGMAEAEMVSQLLGLKIRKLRGFPKHGYFTGTISSFDADSRRFTVAYTDHVREEMTASALEQHLPRKEALLVRSWLGEAKGRDSPPPGATQAGEDAGEAQVLCMCARSRRVASIMLTQSTMHRDRLTDVPDLQTSLAALLTSADLKHLQT